LVHGRTREFCFETRGGAEATYEAWMSHSAPHILTQTLGTI